MKDCNVFSLGTHLKDPLSHEYVIKLKHNQTKEEIIFFKILTQVLKSSFPYFVGCVGKQVPVTHRKGFFILDFYIAKIRTAFEIDGGYHWNSEQLDKDLRRDSILEKEKNIIALHFPNSDIFSKINGISHFNTTSPCSN